MQNISHYVGSSPCSVYDQARDTLVSLTREAGLGVPDPGRVGVMPAPRKYPDELRRRAIRLVRDLVDDEGEGLSVTAASRRVGDQWGSTPTR